MRIFVDMDEVIADTYGAHISLYNSEFQGHLTPENCAGKEVWHMVPEAHQDSVRKHAYRRGFFRDLKPIADSVIILKELAAQHDIYIASAAMQFPNSLEEKSHWLDEHFSFIPWQNRILCGHKHVLNGDVLIDDRSYNLLTFDGRGILFTSPHNINTEGYERADTWLEIGKKLI